MKYIYCGTWNFREPETGIKGFRFNENSRQWEEAGIWGDQPGQSILAVAGDFLVSVCELDSCARLVSYAVQEDGSLQQRSILKLEGSKLSYITASPDGEHLFVSSMGNGTVRMIRLADDGTMALTDEWKLTGHGVTRRQNQAKIHSVILSPDGGLLAAANLGADEVELFSVDRKMEKLRLADSAPIDLCKEPRHMAFHPNGGWLYVLTENGNRLYVFSVLGERLQEYAIYSVLNPMGEQKGAAADIAVRHDGKMIYTTNRGQNNIAVWRVLPSGLLDHAGFYDCGGCGPRGLHLSSDGRTLFCANNDDGTVAVLSLSEEGIPEKTSQRLAVPGAGCVRSI